MATVERAAAEARAAGATLLLDPAPAADVPDQLLALASLVTPNESELAALAAAPLLDGPAPDDEIDRRAQRLLARGAGAVLVKLGARGARLVTPVATRGLARLCRRRRRHDRRRRRLQRRAGGGAGRGRRRSMMRYASPAPPARCR